MKKPIASLRSCESRRVVMVFRAAWTGAALLKAATLALGPQNALGVTARANPSAPRKWPSAPDRARAWLSMRVLNIQNSRSPITPPIGQPLLFLQGRTLRPPARDRGGLGGGAVVADGSIADDLGDYRPGCRRKARTRRPESLVRSGIYKGGRPGDCPRLGPAQPCQARLALPEFAHSLWRARHARETPAGRGSGTGVARARIPAGALPASRRNRADRSGARNVFPPAGAPRGNSAALQGNWIPLYHT
jgi:hypothetical protein